MSYASHALRCAAALGLGSVFFQFKDVGEPVYKNFQYIHILCEITFFLCCFNFVLCCFTTGINYILEYKIVILSCNISQYCGFCCFFFANATLVIYKRMIGRALNRLLALKAMFYCLASPSFRCSCFLAQSHLRLLHLHLAVVMEKCFLEAQCVV